MAEPLFAWLPSRLSLGLDTPLALCYGGGSARLATALALMRASEIQTRVLYYLDV